MREVAFAEQMTQGEKTGKKILSPSQSIRLTAPSSEGAKHNPTANKNGSGAQMQWNYFSGALRLCQERPLTRTGMPACCVFRFVAPHAPRTHFSRLMWSVPWSSNSVMYSSMRSSSSLVSLWSTFSCSMSRRARSSARMSKKTLFSYSMMAS